MKHNQLISKGFQQGSQPNGTPPVGREAGDGSFPASRTSSSDAESRVDVRVMCPGERIMFRKEAKRWLKALKIARIILEDQGYQTAHVEAMEKLIRRRIMYSPKIKEEFIPVLFRISASKGIPMTKLVNQIIREYLEGDPSPGLTEVVHERESETGSSKHSPEV
jgi:hypothetical protein